MNQKIETILQTHFKINDIINIEQNDIGHTTAQVYIISTTKTKFVLKIHDNPEDKYLYNLRARLSWLQALLPISKVEAYKIIENQEYLLTDFIEGIPAFEYGYKSKIDNLGIILGESLRNIHEINIQDCPFKTNIDSNISKLLGKIEKNCLKQDLLIPYFPQLNKNEIMTEIKSLLTQESDQVFSHGDYCLPNIILANNKLSGVIDLGDSGIADRHHDILDCLWSLKFNNLEYYTEDFINSYGKDKVSELKLKLFELMDEDLSL